MCHFCTYVFVSVCVYMLMCMHLKFSFKKQEMMNGKVSFSFCFLPVSMLGKTEQNKPTKS